jgi:hypothetical protein
MPSVAPGPPAYSGVGGIGNDSYDDDSDDNDCDNGDTATNEGIASTGDKWL